MHAADAGRMRPISQIVTGTACASLVFAAPAAADFHLNSHGHGGRAPGVATVAAVAKAATLGGHSNQNEPVVADVAKARKTVSLNAAYISTCDDGSGWSSLRFKRVKVGKKGKFSVAK